MQMDILRCKTPDMVRKEIAAHLLGYNLIRAVMGEAAAPEQLPLRRLSFSAARRAVVQYQEALRHFPTKLHRAAVRFVLLQSIASNRIPIRPGRIEPRAIKRRPKPRKLLTVPRHVAREQIRRTRVGASPHFSHRRRRNALAGRFWHPDRREPRVRWAGSLISPPPGCPRAESDVLARDPDHECPTCRSAPGPVRG